MPFYLQPGVFPQETDLSQVITGLSPSVGAVVGASKRGPVKTRVLVTDIKSFIEVFGEPDATVSFMHYTALAFLSVARQMYVVRAYGSGALHAGIEISNGSPGYIALASGIQPTAVDANPSFTFTVGPPAGVLLIYALGPGSYANSEISVKVTNIDTTTYSVPVFDIEVYQTVQGVKSKVETWTVSKSRGLDGFGSQLFCEDRINGKSKFIKVLNNSSTSATPVAMASDVLLTQGADGSAVSSADIEGPNGWEMFANTDDVNVNILMCGGVSTASTAAKIESIARSRRDAIAILVVPSGSQDGTSELTYRTVTLNLNSSYAALYTPDLKIFDQYSNRELYVPPDGYVGAIMAFTDQSRDPWIPPAGLQRGIVNVRGLRVNYTSGQRDALYSKQINFFRAFPGEGIVLWGQKTLQSKDSATGRVNVRRLLIVLEKSIVNALNKFTFEANTDFTRAQVKAIIDLFMQQVKARSGVTEFRVVCDKTNNPPAVIDANELRVDVYIQPTRAAEFIRLQTVITRTGADINELIVTGGNF